MATLADSFLDDLDELGDDDDDDEETTLNHVKSEKTGDESDDDEFNGDGQLITIIIYIASLKDFNIFLDMLLIITYY
jgi:hypothetical protein